MDTFFPILLAAVAPTIAISSVNMNLFSASQVRNSLILVAAVGILAASVYSLLNLYVLTPWLTQATDHSAKIVDLVTCLTALAIFFFLSEKAFSELLPSKKAQMYVIAGLSIFFSACTWMFSIHVLTAVLGVYASLSVYDLIRNMDFSDLERAEPIYRKNIRFKHKPNVYVLFLESFHSKETLRDFYGIESTGFQSELADEGFTLYDNVYSNRTTTAKSFLSMVWPQLLYHHPYDINDKNGYAPNAFSVFEENGYQVNIYSSDHIKCFFPMLFHNLGTTFSWLGHKIEKLFSPVLSQNSLFRDALSTPDIFEHEENFEGRFEALREKMQTADTPQVQVFHFGACHIEGHALDDFKALYNASYAHAVSKVGETITAIKEKDPSPLIIAVGDHGAKMLNGASDLDADVKERIRSHGSTMHARDLCSVFLGIHWPVDHYTGSEEVLSHVRIFNHVFAALCEDPSHLENMMPNISLADDSVHGLRIIARDGAPLDYWPLAFEDRDTEYYIEQTRKHPRNLSSHLDLVDAYQRDGRKDLAIEYLKSLCDKFPKSCEVHALTAQALFSSSTVDDSEAYAIRAFNIDSTDLRSIHLLIDICYLKGEYEKYLYFVQKHLDINPHLVAHRKKRCSDSIIHYISNHTLKETIDFIASLPQQMQEYLASGLKTRQAIDFSSGKDREIDVLIEASERTETREFLEIIETFLVEALVHSTATKDYEATIRIAYAILNNTKDSVGLYVRLATTLEKHGKVHEAIQVYLDAIKSNRSDTLFLQFGLLLLRNKVIHTELDQLKQNALNYLSKVANSLIPSVNFDIKWYAAEYADILEGLHPFLHYMHYSIGLNLKPHPGFDTTKYLSENTDIFNAGIDPALHYYKCGKFENRQSPLIN